MTTTQTATTATWKTEYKNDDWYQIIAESVNARQAAEAGMVFKSGSTWSIIEGDTFRQASPDEATEIETYFARMAAMFAEFGAGEFDLSEYTAQMPAFDATDEAEFASAEASHGYNTACRFGFEM